uniref:RRM domain-containing protein n=1 Tax=Globodera pallida TaxID=36090 RepID=A0A183BUX5_GLOPA
MSASDDEFCNCDWGTQKEEVPPPPPPPPPEQMPLPSSSSNRNWGNTQNRKEKPSQPPPPPQQTRLGSASDDEFCNCDWGTQTKEVPPPPPPPPEQMPMPSSSTNGFSNCDWGNTQNRKGKPPQPLPQEAVNGFSNCNWGNTQNREEVPRQPPPPPPQQMPMPSSSANGFSNCDWGAQKKKVPPPPPSSEQMPLPSACPCPCPCPGVQTRPITPSNILYVEGIEEYRNQLPLLRVEEIARVFFLHIPNVNVVDVKRLLHWDDNHYAVVELDTVDHAKKAISILNGITLSSGHTLTVYFCNLSVSLAPSNNALLRMKAERRRNDSRFVFVEEPVEGEKFSCAQDEPTTPQQPFSNETEEEDADDDATSEYSSCSGGNVCVRPNIIDSDSEAASGSEDETNDGDE